VIREAFTELRAARRKGRFDYHGKVIVVTGGAGGIGSAFARRAADKGATLVVVDLDEIRATSLLTELPVAEPEHLAIRADLTDQEQIAAVMGLSVHTARKYGDDLYKRLGVGSREELMVKFLPRSPSH